MKWPAGFAGSGLACGIKGSGVPDLGVIVADAPVPWAGTFTRNAMAAAPVGWCRGLMGKTVRAVVVNSGNANACTGPTGERAVARTAAAAASLIGCAAEDILIASTGPIGVELPVEFIESGLPDAIEGVQEATMDFATSIMTTDTAMKTATVDVGGATIVGVAKGAAMIAPNMATMLAFITTDAELDPSDLQNSLGTAVSRSFNRISIDACESTNDSVFLLSSGKAGSVDAELFAHALEEVCWSLAQQMVHDAEGGSKVVRIRVTGAENDDHAVELGRAVAASDLWRCAVHGSDPNWGRVLSAIGSIDRNLIPENLSLSIGGQVAFANGSPQASTEDLAKEMSGDEIHVYLTVGNGVADVEVLSTDLSPDYVRLNAYGTT